MRAPSSILLTLLVSCSEPTPPASSSADAGAAHVAEPTTATPARSAPTERAPDTEQVAPTPGTSKPRKRTRSAPAPTNGCRLEADQPLQTGELGSALYLDGVAGLVLFEAKPPALALWLDRGDGTFVVGPRRALDSKVQRASSSCDGSRCELAVVDDAARVLALTVSGTRITPARELASGVDRRFAPALALDGERVHYAYTRSVDEAMHTLWVTRRADDLTQPRDLTPAGHGAAAATFVLGAARPTLVFVDAHAGISPLLELTFNLSGQPSEVAVRTPVSQPYAPPLLSAVQWNSGQVEVMFSAVGRMAMTAIARVPLRKAADPTALVPSQGYGPLWFSAARSSQRALFVLEVPTASTPDAPRSLQLKLLDGKRTDDGPVLAADARRPSVASSPAAGEYLLSYVRGQTVHAAHVRCDD